MPNNLLLPKVLGAAGAFDALYSGLSSQSVCVCEFVLIYMYICTCRHTLPQGMEEGTNALTIR